VKPRGPGEAAKPRRRREDTDAQAAHVTSTGWESRGSRPDLNLSNRRMRTRMSGGVGGEWR